MRRSKSPPALTSVLVRIGVRPKLAEAITKSVDWLDKQGEGSDGLASLLFLAFAQKELDGYTQGKDEAQMVLWVEPQTDVDATRREDVN